MRGRHLSRISAIVLLGAVAAALFMPVVALAAAGDVDVIRYGTLPEGTNVSTDASSWWQNTTFWAGDNSASFMSDGQVTVRVEYIDQARPQDPKSLKDFLGEPSTSTVNAGSGSDIQWLKSTSTRLGSGTTKLGGVEFWYWRGRSKITSFGTGYFQTYGETYFASLRSGGSITIDITANVGGDKLGLDIWEAKAVAIRDSLSFNVPDEAAYTMPEQTGLPWRTVGAGAGALLGAVIATIGAFNSGSKAGKGQKPDPTQVIGFILQLSSARLECMEGRSAPLNASVYQVFADGHYTPASMAAITVTPPPGVLAQPTTGVGSINTLVWPEGAPVSGSLQVTAAAGAGGTQASVEVVGGEQTRLLVGFDPEEKRELTANGIDSVTVTAKVVLSPADLAAGADPAVVNSSIGFVGGQWLALSRAVPWGDGVAVRALASQPDAIHHVAPPPSEALTVSAQVGPQTLTESISIAFARDPEIAANPLQVHLATEGRGTAEVLVAIEHAGTGDWDFRTEWADGSKPLASVDQQRTGPATETLALTEDSAGKLDPARPEDAATLRVLATHDGYSELECHVKVIVSRDGLFIDSTGVDPQDGSFHVLADGSAEPTEVDFHVYVRDEAGVIAPNLALAKALEFELADEEGSVARNVASVGRLEHSQSGERPLNVPAAIHRFTVANEIPADVLVVPVRYTVSVPGMLAEDDKFVKTLTLGLVASTDSPGGPDWQLEYDRCKEIIFKFVPSAYHPTLMGILERRGRHLGADGLYEMRHQIWIIAQNLTLGEGGQGYLEEGKWAGRIETVLSYSEWAGNMAFHAATAHFIGPYYAMGAAMLKDLVVSAIIAYDQNQTPDEWLAQNFSLAFVAGIAEGQLVDVDKFAKLTSGDRVRAWEYFVAYHFFKAYLYEHKSFTDALIYAGEQARDEAIAAWLGEQMRHAAKGPEVDVQKPKQPDGEPSEGPSTARGRSAQTRGRDWAETIRAATEGGKELDAKTVASIMADPDGSRELRRLDPEAYRRYTDARGQMQEAHDGKLQAALEQRYGRKVRIETVGSKKGTDRDYRVMIETPDPLDPSKNVYVEASRAEWDADSYRIFAEQTGGPTGPDTPEMRAAQAAHAEKHQQLATDQGHDQACADMSDQIFVRDSEGNLVPTQRMGPDPETGEIRPLTNLDLVESGQGKLISGDATGKTYQNKVAASMPKGANGKPKPTIDAFVQARKAGHTLEACREGYAKRNAAPEPMDPRLREGRNIVERGAAGDWPPEEANRRLQQAGFKGGLGEYMQRVGAKFTEFDGK